MNFTQSIWEALESLNGNKMRSGLTVLGIVIGVAAVIAMLAVGRGAEASITGSISGIGTNLLFVFRGDLNDTVRNPKPLTMGDANAIADRFAAPSVEAVAPALQGNATVSFGGEQISTQLYGVTPDYFQVRNYSITEGEYINEEHLLGRASVVILGPEVADTIFGLKTTRIRSLSGEQPVFSNNDLLKSRIRNYKRMYERRVLFGIGVIYQTPPEKLELIPKIIREIVESQENTRFDRSHFKEFGDFSLNFETVYWVKDADYNLYMDIHQAINLQIYRRFEKEGIEFAYPSQTLFLNKEGGSSIPQS